MAPLTAGCFAFFGAAHFIEFYRASRRIELARASIFAITTTSIGLTRCTSIRPHAIGCGRLVAPSAQGTPQRRSGFFRPRPRPLP
jgi:hypothetical protein